MPRAIQKKIISIEEECLTSVEDGSDNTIAIEEARITNEKLNAIH